MGKIFYILGKSSTGKDTIYKKLLADRELNLKDIILYTTRPIRQGEIEDKTYHFVTEDEYKAIKAKGDIIEERAYDTMHGLWRYFTVKDGSVDPDINDYIIIGVLDSYISLRDHFGKDKLVPIYIEVDDGIRLQRALNREKKPENGKFKEMCRRYLADCEDFSDEKIKKAGIERRFKNDNLKRCLLEITDYIKDQKEI